MNAGILHASRPSDTAPKSNFGGLPAEAIAMARQMGLGPEDLKQMSSMWRNMDDLADKDPETYRKFTGDILAEGPPEHGQGKPKAFFPTPSFVVKVTSLSDGGKKLKGTHEAQKFFINMTSCEALEPPKDHFGCPVEAHEKRSADGLQIPLLVGEVRPCPDHSGNPNAACALDTVFHPWVMSRCEEDNTFKAQVIELALQWVEQETKLKFSKQWKTIRSKYKGGSLSIGDEDGDGADARPVPFPIDRAMMQSDPVEEREDESTDREPGAFPTSSSSVSTPGDVLRANTTVEGHDFDMKLPPSGSVGGRVTAPTEMGSEHGRDSTTRLIEEVGADRNRLKKKTPAVKKGFLKPSNKPGQHAPRLYDDSGSSGDGSKEGTYSRFMSKCKVVDLNGMSAEQQQKAMKQHAEDPTHRPSKPQESASTTTLGRSDEAGKQQLEAGFESLNKGFLASNTGESLYGKEGSPEGTSSTSNTKDALFESLIEGVDPDYADASLPAPDPNESDTAFDSLGAIAKLLSGESRPDAQPFNQMDDSVKMATPVRGIDDDEEVTRRPESKVGLHHSLSVKPPVASGGKASAKLSVHLSGVCESIGDVDLEVGEQQVRVRVSSTSHGLLTVPLPFRVHTDATKAKFIKEKATLKVTIFEA